ncbi:MAG: hypothetical protein AAF065_02455 [Verrucomicrobiota bacterium]
MKFLFPILTLLAGTGLGYLLFHKKIETSQSASSPFSLVEDVVSVSYPIDRSPENPGPRMLIEEIDDYGAWLSSLDGLPRSQRLASLYTAMASLSISEYGDVIDSLLGVEAKQHQTFINGLLESWAETDPKSMLGYLDALPQGDFRQKRRMKALSQLAKVDFDAAWAYIRNPPDLPDGMPFPIAIGFFLNEVSKDNPERVLQMLQQPELKKDQSLKSLYRSVFKGIAKSDPSRAQLLASNLPAGQQKTSALTGLIQSTYGKDPLAAKAWLESLPMDASVSRALLSLNGTLSLPTTIEEAEAIANSEPDAAKRRQMVRMINTYGLIKGKSFDEVLQVYEWLEANGSARSVSPFIDQMMSEDQARTIDFVINLPLGRSRMYAINNLANKMANQDIAAAMDFANSLDFEDERQAVLSSVAESIMKDTPEEAIEQLNLLDDVYLERRIAGRISGDLAAYDYGKALAWVNSIEDEKAFNEAQTSLVKTLAGQNMQQAVEYVLSDVAPEERDEFLSMCVLSVSKQNPEEAVDWLGKSIMEDSEQLDQLYQDVTNTYMRFDSIAASEWIAGLETGPQRDSAVKGLVNNIVRYDPDSALIWSSTIENKSSRMNMMQSSVQQLLQKDPKTAESAILDADINDEEKDQLLKLVKS